MKSILEKKSFKIIKTVIKLGLKIKHIRFFFSKGPINMKKTHTTFKENSRYLDYFFSKQPMSDGFPTLIRPKKK